MEPYLRADLLPVLSATPEQTTWDVPGLRAGGEELFGSLTPNLEGVSLTVRRSGAVEMRVISPKPATPEEPGTPARSDALILSIHGGGYVAGLAQYDDEKNACMAVRLNAEVVSVEYRLAPEHPFPAGIDDCLEALRWCARIAAKRGVPLYVFGDSAGGGLAYFSAVRYCSERCLDPHGSAADDMAPLSGIILLEPCLDPRTNTPSFHTYADGPVWTKKAGEQAWKITATTDHSRAEVIQMLEDPQRVQGLPKVMIVANPADPLRDEDIRLAQHLADSGVCTELHMYAGTFHGSLSVSGNPVWEELLVVIKRFIS